MVCKALLRPTFILATFTLESWSRFIVNTSSSVSALVLTLPPSSPSPVVSLNLALEASMSAALIRLM